MRKIFVILGILLAYSTPILSQANDALPQPVKFNSGTSDSLTDETYRFHSRPNIAVLPLNNANAAAEETGFGRTISAMLATALRSKTNFVVLERRELHGILNEQSLDMAGLTKEKTAKIGKLYNVEVILVGDVSYFNNTLHIDLRLIETASSKVAVALYGTCQDLKNIREEVERLAKDLEQSYLRQWMGSIHITSEPAGSEVYLEDKFIGLTDAIKPLKIKDLLEGIYHLKFIRGGYYDWEGEIAVQAKMERTVKVSLIGKPGSMNINSEPADARIFLDNNEVGSTPMSLKKVAEGEHEIRLIKDNYREWNQKVTVRSFQPTDVKAILEVSPGRLTVNSTPDAASIYFKGKFVAKTPYTLSNISPGEVVIRIEKEGYEDWTTSVLIQPNQNEILDIVLVRKVGTLSITSRPERATVSLQRQNETVAKKIGETPILNYLTTIGSYTIVVEKPDYFSSTQEVTVEHQKIRDVSFELNEKPGSVSIETVPSNARIFLDGEFKGRSPFKISAVPKGEYQLSLRLPYAEKNEQVNVASNRQTVVKTNFVKSKRYIFAITSIGVAGLVFHFLAE